MTLREDATAGNPAHVAEETAGTPRVEEELTFCEYADRVWRKWVKADFARQLEREVAALTAERDRDADFIAELQETVARYQAHNESLLERAEAAEAELDAAKRALVEKGRENVIITDMNHGQFLELEYLRPIFKAARDLYDQSEEYEYDEGMGRGAPQDYWDQLASSFEPATEAIQEVIDAAALAAKSTEHQWDRDGERCVKCGQKDWMEGECKSTEHGGL